MPRLATRMCRVPGCPQVTWPGHPCHVHGEAQHGWRHNNRAEHHGAEHRRLKRLVVGYWRGTVWVEGEERECWRCGALGTTDDQLGHIVALAEGGQTVRENVHRECRSCNVGAGARLGRQRANARRRGAA